MSFLHDIVFSKAQDFHNRRVGDYRVQMGFNVFLSCFRVFKIEIMEENEERKGKKGKDQKERKM